MGTFYNYSLVIHSWNRWLIIVAGVVLIIMLVAALKGRLRNTQNINKVALTFIISLHLQLLIGLLLYFFLSPLTQAAFNDFGSAMKNSGLRFWAVEHSLLTLVGIILAQIGYSKAKRINEEKLKQKTMLIWMGIALFLILLVIPMGIMGIDRPWFRF
jgi:cytochrome c biogenesis protein CcdA